MGQLKCFIDLKKTGRENYKLLVKIPDKKRASHVIINR